MTRIVNTTPFGWIDMDHVLRITPIEYEPSPDCPGGRMVFYVYVMMRDAPFSWQGTWDRQDGPTADQREEANDTIYAFILQWRGK
jgi:hypothetical protein